MAPGPLHQAVVPRFSGQGAARFLLASTLALCCCALSAASAPRTPPPIESGREFFIVANTQFTALHEVGHALMTELQLPFPGGEEDVSDQLAAALLTGGATPDPRAGDKLIAAAQGWLIEWQLQKDGADELEYWDSHPLDIQRYYNIVCLVHGGIPSAQAALRAQLQLPYTRAWRCDSEYERAVRGLKWISANYGAGGGAVRRLPSKVRVVYEPPGTPERTRLRDLIRRSQVLEQSARLIEAHLSLPNDISIVLANICGATAYWRRDLQEIIVCYSLVERFERLSHLQPCLVTGRNDLPLSERDIGRCVRERIERHGRP